MTDPTTPEFEPTRRSRARRREAMMNAVATVLGCLALVVMIATVVRVVMVKLWESAKVNPAYVEAVYEDQLERRWSGNVSAQPALLPVDQSDGTATLQGRPTAQPSADVSVPSRIESLVSAPTGELHSGIANIESKRVRIENTVRGFFEAGSIEAKLTFARDPERVRTLMSTYYQSHELEQREWKNLGWVLPIDEPGYRLGYAQAIFANTDPVSLIIEETAQGSFRVDWESSVRYSELEWDEFVKTRPAAPTLLRVIASKSQAISTDDAPQDSEFLEIKPPGGDDVIVAYFDRHDPKFEPLLQQLQVGNWKDVPLTLRLCYPGSAGSGKSVKIADIEGKGWLILQGTRS